MEIVRPNKKQLKLLKNLYISSFPTAERKPFKLMQLWERCGKTEILSICDGDRFCGLIITVLYKDMVLIDYLATCEELRGTGIGSQSIKLIRERYRGKRIFLEVESTLKPCDDLNIRQRRKNFYLRNGLSECGISVLLFGVEMELLTFDNPVSYEEYCRLYRHLAGNMINGKISRVE